MTVLTLVNPIAKDIIESKLLDSNGLYPNFFKDSSSFDRFIFRGSSSFDRLLLRFISSFINILMIVDIVVARYIV
jgi:hypothetical protein